MFPRFAQRSFGVSVVIVLMLALSGLDQTVLSTALPTIVQSLHGQSLAA